MAFELKDVPPGRYKIIASTFMPGQEGPFFLEVAASAAFNLSKAWFYLIHENGSHSLHRGKQTVGSKVKAAVEA